MSSSAYLLVYHGSRDPRPAQAIQTLAHLIRQQLKVKNLAIAHQPIYHTINLPNTSQASPVEIAALELSPIPFHQKIQEFAQQVGKQGFTHLQIIPLFLLPGVHVKEDIPKEIILAEQAISATIQLELIPHLGAYQELIPLLHQQFEKLPTATRILLSHGSRYPGSYQAIENICSQLNAIPAYWSVVPSLETQVQSLIHKNCQAIAIIPYFLFSGGITDAIIEQVQQLQTTFPQVNFYLGEPLNATEALAQVILQGIR